MAKTVQNHRDVYRFFGRTIAVVTEQGEIRLPARNLRPADVGVICDAMLTLVAKNSPGLYPGLVAQIKDALQRVKPANVPSEPISPFVQGLAEVQQQTRTVAAKKAS